MNTVSVRAPSNIALAKYMGKSDSALNIPENPSVSMTLSSLCTDLSVSETAQADDCFSEEKPYFTKGTAPNLSDGGRAKFLRHVERVRGGLDAFFSEFGLEARNLQDRVEIKSANTFPHGSGIASSASSFAALTLGVATFYAKDREAFRDLFDVSAPFRRKLSEISRQGSGSSCRSFAGPFVSWDQSTSRSMESGLEPLRDLILVAGRDPKTVGSSEAHQRVKTSPLWKGRVKRAMDRHCKILDAIHHGDFETLALTSWEEFFDMHDLFHTSAPSFTYWNDTTRLILESLSHLPMDRVCVTMDAGPNVHCLVRESEATKWKSHFDTVFPGVEILEDHAGRGAEIIEVST